MVIGPAITHGVKHRRKSLDDTPAPNYYAYDYRGVDGKPRGGIIPKSSRRSKTVMSRLGPGLYNYKLTLGEGPAISMGMRHSTSDHKFTPGPGMYNIGYKRPKSAKSNMSRADRLDKLENSVPGVGHYNLTNQNGN